jgi:hypothetical protein
LNAALQFQLFKPLQVFGRFGYASLLTAHRLQLAGKPGAFWPAFQKALNGGADRVSVKPNGHCNCGRRFAQRDIFVGKGKRRDIGRCHEWDNAGQRGRHRPQQTGFADAVHAGDDIHAGFKLYFDLFKRAEVRQVEFVENHLVISVIGIWPVTAAVMSAARRSLSSAME